MARRRTPRALLPRIARDLPASYETDDDDDRLEGARQESAISDAHNGGYVEPPPPGRGPRVTSDLLTRTATLETQLSELADMTATAMTEISRLARQQQPSATPLESRSDSVRSFASAASGSPPARPLCRDWLASGFRYCPRHPQCRYGHPPFPGGQ